MRRTPEGPSAAGRLLLLGMLTACPPETAACPFCGVVDRPLAARRDAAAVTAVGDAAGPAETDADGVLVQPFAVRQAIRGRAAVGGAATARVAAPIAGTAVLFGGESGWEAIAADEPLLAHVAAAPDSVQPAAARLSWFARRLEHPDPAVAADAFAEFGLAPFAAVRDAAAAFDPEKLHRWIGEPGIDQRRRGFYGLALGIVAAAEEDPDRRRRHVAALRTAVESPGNDLRAGFDGLLAGIVVAEAAAGLEFLAGRGLLAGDTRAGDARHALAVLRFSWENLGDTVPRPRVAAATARLVDNPAVAADATVDLARYGDWSALEAVAGLWDRFGRDDPLVRRAVAGYLAACPLPAARGHLDRLREADPVGVRQALEAAAGPR